MQVLSGEHNSDEILNGTNDIQDNEKTTEIRDLLDVHESNTSGSDEQERLHFPGISEILPSLHLCGAGLAMPLVLGKLGIKFVVNAAPELPDTPLPDSKPLYLRVNILDKGDADLKTHFDEVADLIEEVRESDGKTLVHCVAGVSRSASLVIAYLMKHMGMSLRDAYHHVKSIRPQIRPNIGFFRQLIAYEEELRGSKSVEMIYRESLGQEIPDVYEPEYRAMEEFYQRQRRNGKRR